MSESPLERHFHGLAGLPPAERVAALERVAAESPELVSRLEALLRAHDRAEAGQAGLGESLDAARATQLLEGVPLAAGDSIDRYRVIRTLGRGSAGVVYLAHDAELDRPVALKVFPPSFGSDRLLDEARAAAALDHPSIGTVYEVGRTSDGRRFIAMAPYDEGTLRDRIRGGPLRADDALEVARQVADALATAHAAGIVHCDVKPENLVFDRRGRVKLVDFGLASDDARGGTPAYMSPEQRRGEPADAQSDVWAFGVVAYEMLTGRRPDPDDLDADVARGTLSGLPSGTPPELALVVRHCLEADRANRPRSGEALVHELGPAAGAVAPMVRGIPGLPTPFALVAGIALAVVVGVLVGLAARGDAPRLLDAQGSAAGAFPERGWVVVADFDGADGTEDLALAAREALAVDLQQSEFVRVASRAQIGDVLRRMDLPADAHLDLPRAMEVGERFGAGAVLGATISRAGSDFVLSGRALDPRTGAELFAVRTAAPDDALLGAVERLSREMRARLGESAEALARSRPLPEVTTNSIEALRLYAEAERTVGLDYERAARLIDAALDADSAFAMAHRLAAANATARLQFGETAEHLARAYRFRERLPERERWHVEAIHHLQVAFEPRQASAAYELLVERYPDDARAWNNLGVIRQGWLDDDTGSLEAFERAFALDSSNAGYVSNLVQANYIGGHPARADSMAALVERLGLANETLRWRVTRAFAERRDDVAVEGCRALLEASDASVATADDREICGSMDVAMGRTGDAVARLTAVRDAYLDQGRLRNATHAVQALAMARALAGDTAAAEAEFRWALERVPGDRLAESDRLVVLTNMAVHAHLLGLDDIARRVTERYAPFPDADHWFARHGEALIAAAEAVSDGDGSRALQVLEPVGRAGYRPIGWRIWDELVRALAYEEMGDRASATRHFEAAGDPGLITFAFATKDRIHRGVADKGAARR